MSCSTVGSPVTGFLPLIIVENRDGERVEWVKKTAPRVTSENEVIRAARADARTLDKLMREHLRSLGYRLREGAG